MLILCLLLNSNEALVHFFTEKAEKLYNEVYE